MKGWRLIKINNKSVLNENMKILIQKAKENSKLKGIKTYPITFHVK